MIQASLKSLKSEEKEQVERLFSRLACFAPDTSLPAGIFDALAPMLLNDGSGRGEEETAGGASAAAFCSE